MDNPITDLFKKKRLTFGLATQILSALLLGALLGLTVRFLPHMELLGKYLISGFLSVIGTIFINSIKMIVVPMVFISLVAGITQQKNSHNLTRLSLNTFALFILSTVLAGTLALIIANLFHIGIGSSLTLPFQANTTTTETPTLTQFIINIVPLNPFAALASDNILQVMFLAILLGSAINLASPQSNKIAEIFSQLNAVLLQMINLLMKIAPIGVFALIANLFFSLGTELLLELLDYCLVFMLILVTFFMLFHVPLLAFIAKINPLTFFKKNLSLILFALSSSSSNASLPLALETAREKMGVANSVASLALPLGINMNKYGTVILQVVASIFLANLYHIKITLLGSLSLLFLSTIVTIGTAGSQSGGLLTLVVVLNQLGIPTSGIALIFGVDRILDMVRTVANILGNMTITCVIAQASGQLDHKVFKAE